MKKESFRFELKGQTDGQTFEFLEILLELKSQFT